MDPASLPLLRMIGSTVMNDGWAGWFVAPEDDTGVVGALHADHVRREAANR
ncbi:hypothetical protein [Streptomyces sp. NPDC097610]|uniref:hypothetical protein n=1 Tax=Streptomyces sp. NPDC097610 TaxID=3157227 RepID=UPI0033293405